MFTLVNVSEKHVSMTSDVKLMTAIDLELCEIRIAEAILVNSPLLKVLANTYMMFYKPITPTKMFTRKESALKWFELIRE